MGDSDLLALIEHNATSHFRTDSGCPLEWEPSGYDFLSPCLQVGIVVHEESRFHSYIFGLNDVATPFVAK